MNDLDGHDPKLIARVLPFLEALARKYFHLHVTGEEKIPERPAMFVANHSGGFLGPDIFCTLAVLWRNRKPESPLYTLARVKRLGRILKRFGALRATSANARRALESGGQVLVFPGGDPEAFRHFQKRNEVMIFPRTGFARIARDCNVPIVPIVAKGAHRSAIIFSEGEVIARALKMSTWARFERFPFALALPWGVAVGPWMPYMPLPLPIKMQILEPVEPDPQPEKTASRVQHAMQSAMAAM